MNEFWSPLRRGFGLLAAVLLLLCSQVIAASAHASLIVSTPADGITLAVAPGHYSLTFSEPVSPITLSLVKPDGASIALSQFELRDRTLAIEAPLHLGRGSHVLSWRVVSEDGHPIGGSIVFSIGTANATAAVAENGTDWTVRNGLWLAKVALYAGLFIGIGGAFARCVLMPGINSGSSMTKSMLLLGTLGALVSAGFQGLDVLGAEAGRILDPIVWQTGFATSYGRTVLALIIAFALSGAAMGLNGRPGRVAATLGLILGGSALALSGHASAADPQWLMRPMVFLHATAIAVWVGALAPLGLALREREPQAGAALSRFSSLIPAIVGLLALAGIALAIVQIQRPGALLDTAYGQIFTLKLLLLVALFLLAAVNRWSLTPAVVSGEESAKRRLIRSIATETLIVMLVLGVAAAWRFTPPPRSMQAFTAQPVIEMFQNDKLMAHVQISPGSAGSAVAAVGLFDLDHSPVSAKEVTLVLALPEAGIEPFKRPLKRLDEGSWRADGVGLPLPGNWHVRVDVLVSDFEIIRLEGQIRIEP